MTLALAPQQRVELALVASGLGSCNLWKVWGRPLLDLWAVLPLSPELELGTPVRTGLVARQEPKEQRAQLHLCS